jgi:hypothetical protein
LFRIFRRLIAQEDDNTSIIVEATITTEEASSLHKSSKIYEKMKAYYPDEILI